MIYILYNPLAGNKDSEDKARKLSEIYPGRELKFLDIRNVTNYQVFIEGLEQKDELIICGGDGTLNRFINATEGITIHNSVYYYATGNGNDFLRDVAGGKADKPIRINKYIKHLPVVTANGKSYRFLNGVGYGIDGFCCEVGDKLKEKGKKPNYTMIAIKGLLLRYKATNATVTVDGVSKKYKRVWIAPTMNGRFYGGGMMPTPDQNRNDRTKGVSVMLMHKAGRLRTLCIFPSIFKGKHIKHRKVVDVIQGHSITVEFDRPVALQIDGETVLNVSKYQVQSGAY